MGFSFGGAVRGFVEADAVNAGVEANNRISLLNAKTKNNQRLFQAGAASAAGNLARWVQSVNNNKQLDSGGNAVEALIVNSFRRTDGQLKGNFSDTIRNAEEAGRAAAGAAFSGIDGSVVDMINGSTALRNTIIAQNTSDQMDMAAYDTTRRAGTIMSQMVGGLNNSIILDSIDYNRDTAKQGVKVNKWIQAAVGFLGGNAGNMANSFTGGSTTSTDSQEQSRQKSQENFRKFEFTDSTQDQYKTSGNPYSVGSSNEYQNEDYDAYDNSGDLWSR